MTVTSQVQYINPETLNKNPAFTNVVVVTGAVKTVYVGGQDAVDAAGNIIGKGDLKAQTEQVLKNIEAALAAGEWRAALGLLWLRLAAGLVTGVSVLGSRGAARLFWLMPLRDLWGFAVWLRGMTGDTVEWRGARLRLDRQGKIINGEALLK